MARTSGILNGTDLLVYDGVTPFVYSNSCKISLSADMRDITNKDSAGWKAILPSLKSWGVEGSGLIILNETTGQYNLVRLMSLIKNKIRVTLKVATSNSGDYYFQGYAYLASFSVDAPNEGNTTYSMSFTGDGELHLYDTGGTPTPLLTTT